MSGKVKTTIGVVVKVDHRQQSIVSGSGGGGIVGTLPNGQVVGSQKPITISTHTYSKNIIWVKTYTGAEIEFRINDDSFSCREGHKIGVIDDDTTIYVLHNFMTNRTARYFTAASIQAIFAPVGEHPSPAIIILAVICGIIGAIGISHMVTGSERVPEYYIMAAMLIFPVLFFIYRNKKQNALHDKELKANKDAEEFFYHLKLMESELMP